MPRDDRNALSSARSDPHLSDEGIDMEAFMARKIIDCRDYPESACTIALSADSEEELVEAAAQHAIKTHGHPDTPELRDELRKMAREEGPAA